MTDKYKAKKPKESLAITRCLPQRNAERVLSSTQDDLNTAHIPLDL